MNPKSGENQLRKVLSGGYTGHNEGLNIRRSRPGEIEDGESLDRPSAP